MEFLRRLGEIFKHHHDFKMDWFYEKANLRTGGYTSFCIERCKCGAWKAVPKFNLHLAINEGTDKTFNTLRYLGISIRKDDINQSREGYNLPW